MDNFNAARLNSIRNIGSLFVEATAKARRNSQTTRLSNIVKDDKKAILIVLNSEVKDYVVKNHQIPRGRVMTLEFAVNDLRGRENYALYIDNSCYQGLSAALNSTISIIDEQQQKLKAIDKILNPQQGYFIK